MVLKTKFKKKMEGGEFRIIKGKVIEKVGVNFSNVKENFQKNLQKKFLEQKKF